MRETNTEWLGRMFFFDSFDNSNNTWNTGCLSVRSSSISNADHTNIFDRRLYEQCSHHDACFVFQWSETKICT